ncbi:MAG: M13 family metallopeptidase [Hydrogenoanaerobacterium sp.]
MMKKLISLLLAITLSISAFTGCSGAKKEPEAPSAAKSSQSTSESAPKEEAPQWINSNILGSVTEETKVSLKDDFHLAMNKDWLATAKIGEGHSQVSVLNARDDEVRNQILSLIKGKEQTTHEGKLVQQLFKDYMDIEKRNERGLKPLIPFIEEIQKIKTLDDLTAYTLRLDQFNNSLFTKEAMADFKDSTNSALYINGTHFMLGDADEYKQMTSVGKHNKIATTAMLQKLLERLGYTPESAASTIDLMFSLETKIASASLGSSDMKQPNYASKIYNPFTLEALKEASPTFPIVTMLKDYTDVGINRFILTDTKWLSKMNELYTPENIEGFKAILLCNTISKIAPYLDQECMVILDEFRSTMAGITIHSVLEDKAYNLCSEYLDMTIGRMFAENYVSPDTKQTVEKLITEVVAIYKKRLSATEWLGKETREKAIEKLDNLQVRVAYPDDWSKYDVSDIVFSKEGSLIDDILAIDLHSHHEQIKSLLEPIDSEKWDGLSPQTVNAFYNLTDNSINIMAGILGGVFYNPEGSIEETTGGIGVIIGHEITHAFDTRGSQYDKNGNLNNWWTDADRAAFVELTNKVDAYFSSIEVLPGKYVDGQLTIGETVADLGGFSCMLEMAKNYKNFNYESFFKKYAHIWPEKESIELSERLLQDVHAPGYLRTNVTVQQFQEFYDTFGISEGDGMYLAPKRRLSVW